ncbi:choline uptake/conversion transcriptional regulator CudC [Staphylococcus massiliensis]|uniref:HTH-type transcriptional regulator n=1 Tax=Staphylococcus massiliensis S46 TaxID=1229783 RepID=K9B2F0_9STAP|nr:GbsR/MarR family transcriptional regulator [Staphylococcus massiliensis]EKU48952.1 transcriptional regulator [Staphylococcus massiliensis S46]MCG3399392.1 GbsR/MarR family transcriptional regulator [Staphylococcus massiliensis]MCG3402507.1 GbsR/MarR family transcriptional regulator [Staphylococcus massiliensis]MCG3411528.1 GbsR/MarR family transcriptional regulator [Staphylococcus massiliensis]PNZ98766.1 GbsR/MarR family transcriptional regulator [Staphylococcus massiliensis CCUG 55927]
MAESKTNQDQLNHAKDIFINSIGETMDLYGINRSVGNLYGTMLFEDSMTLDEMREQLQMSKPSMSAGVKKLQEFEIVKQQFTRGSRKQHFVAEKDFFNFFTNFFSQKWERETKINMMAIEEALGILDDVMSDKNTDDETLKEAKHIYDQLESSKDYFNWLGNLSDAIKTGEIFKHYPIPTEHKTK